jgi:hypothetical protein
MLILPTTNIFYAISSSLLLAIRCILCFLFLVQHFQYRSDWLTLQTITVPSATTSVSDVNFKAIYAYFFYLMSKWKSSPKGTTVKLFDRSCGYK